MDPATLVGTEATEFDLAATAEGTALGVDPAPIGAIAESRLASRVKPGWTLVAAATTPTIGTPVRVRRGRDLPGDDQRRAGPRRRPGRRSSPRSEGLVLADARAALDEFGDVEITLWPDWVTKVPTQADRITFTLGEPQPSATP